MKLEKKILIIDDKSQATVIDSLKTDLKGEFDLKCEAIKTSSSELRQETSDHLDFKKLKKTIQDHFEQQGNFDLILTDFDLNEQDNVDGLDVVDFIKSQRESAKIMMYSGNFTQVVKKVIHSKNNKLSDEEVADAVTKLVNYNIIKFTDRTSYKDEVKKYFKKNSEVSIKNEFISLLYEHKDMVFNSCFPEFSGKTFGEIANIIENKKDARSDKWMIDLIHQTIAYLVKIN